MKKTLVMLLLVGTSVNANSIRDFFDQMEEEFSRTRKFFGSPEKNIYSQNGNIVVEMSVPGMKPEDIKVTVEGRNLIVKGKQKETSEEKGKHYYVREMKGGAFEMSMLLPVEVVSSKANATVENGRLKVVIPKKDKQEPKKIEISVK